LLQLLVGEGNFWQTARGNMSSRLGSGQRMPEGHRTFEMLDRIPQL
jgi:hypothetical protein